MSLENEKIYYDNELTTIKEYRDGKALLENGKRVAISVAMKNGILRFINQKINDQLLFEIKNEDIIYSEKVKLN